MSYSDYYNSEDYGFDASSGGDNSSSGTSDLVASLISAGTSIGTTAILATQAPNSIAPNSYIPAAGNAAPGIYGAQAAYAQANMNSRTWLFVGVLAIAGLLVYKKL